MAKKTEKVNQNIEEPKGKEDLNEEQQEIVDKIKDNVKYYSERYRGIFGAEEMVNAAAIETNTLLFGIFCELREMNKRLEEDA